MLHRKPIKILLVLNLVILILFSSQTLFSQFTVQGELFIESGGYLYVEDDIKMESENCNIINNGTIEITQNLYKDSVSLLTSSNDIDNPSVLYFKPIKEINPLIKGDFTNTNALDVLVIELQKIENQIRLADNIEIKQALEFINGRLITDTISHDHGSNYNNFVFISQAGDNRINGYQNSDSSTNYIEGKLRRTIDTMYHEFPIGLHADVDFPRRFIRLKSTSIDTVLVYYDPVDIDIQDQFLICDLGEMPNIFEPDGVLDSLLIIREVGNWILNSSGDGNGLDVSIEVIDFYDSNSVLKSLKVDNNIDCPKDYQNGLNVENIWGGNISIVEFNDDIISNIQETKDESSLILFPNPVRSNHFFRVESNQILKAAQILNQNGKVVKSIDSIDSNSVQISTDSLTPGFYILKTIHDNNKHVHFIKLIIYA